MMCSWAFGAMIGIGALAASLVPVSAKAASPGTSVPRHRSANDADDLHHGGPG